MLKSGKLPNFLYIVVFIISLLLFIAVKFPTESVEKRIIAEIKQNAPFPIQIEDLEYKFPSTFDFSGVTLVTKGGTKVELDGVRIKAGLFSLMATGRMKIPYDARLYNGRIDGAIYYLKEEKRVSKIVANIDSIDSSPIPELVSKNTSLELDGSLSGNINVSIPMVEGKKMPSGSYLINSEKLTIRNFELNKIKFDEEYKDLKTELRGSISGLTTNIENLSFVNNDLDLKFQGQMPTPWKLQRGAKIDLLMNLKLKSPEAKLALLKAILEPQRDGTLRGRIFGPAYNPKLVNSNKKIDGT